MATPIHSDKHWPEYNRAQKWGRIFAEVRGVDLGLLHDPDTPLPHWRIGIRFLIDSEKTPPKLERLISTLKAPTRTITGLLKCEKAEPGQPNMDPSLLVKGQPVYSKWGHRGSLGMVVYSKKNGEPHLLSSAHVLCPFGYRRGLPVRFEPGAGKPHYAVVSRAISDNRGDAAIAKLLDSYHPRLANQPAIRSTRLVRLRDVVTKYGSATDKTQGIVDGIGRYRFLGEDGQTQWIRGFRIVPVDGHATHDTRREISTAGDSGAVWFIDRGREAIGVGLHIAGESTVDEAECAFACHLPIVLDALDVHPFYDPQDPSLGHA